MEQQIKTRKPREANFINITDSLIKEKIKNMVILPNKDLHLNYVLWYKKETPNDWGLTIKGFPDKKFGTQHVFKITWFADKDETNGNVFRLVPADHCNNQTQEINGDGFNEIFNIYNKYKK